jgi:hypothetical protein
MPPCFRQDSIWKFTYESLPDMKTFQVRLRQSAPAVHCSLDCTARAQWDFPDAPGSIAACDTHLARAARLVATWYIPPDPPADFGCAAIGVKP